MKFSEFVVQHLERYYEELSMVSERGDSVTKWINIGITLCEPYNEDLDELDWPSIKTKKLDWGWMEGLKFVQY